MGRLSKRSLPIYLFLALSTLVLNWPVTHCNLFNTYANSGRTGEAIAQQQQTVRLLPLPAPPTTTWA